MQALEIILAKEMKAFSSSHEYLIQNVGVVSLWGRKEKTNRHLTVILWETWWLLPTDARKKYGLDRQALFKTIYISKPFETEQTLPRIIRWTVLTISAVWAPTFPDMIAFL